MRFTDLVHGVSKSSISFANCWILGFSNLNVRRFKCSQTSSRHRPPVPPPRCRNKLRNNFAAEVPRRVHLPQRRSAFRFEQTKAHSLAVLSRFIVAAAKSAAFVKTVGRNPGVVADCAQSNYNFRRAWAISIQQLQRATARPRILLYRLLCELKARNCRTRGAPVMTSSGGHSTFLYALRARRSRRPIIITERPRRFEGSPANKSRKYAPLGVIIPTKSAQLVRLPSREAADRHLIANIIAAIRIT